MYTGRDFLSEYFYFINIRIETLEMMASEEKADIMIKKNYWSI